MKRIASFLLVLSLLAAFALPVIEPTYSALAQPDGSVVSDQPGDESTEPPTEIPTDVPAPTDTPVPPPTDTPPPPPTDTPVPSEVPATATQEPSATEEPIQPAAATEVPDYQVGDLVAATTRVNCRETPNGAAMKVLADGEQAYVIAEAQPAGGYQWIGLQLVDATTTQCYSADKYFKLISQGNTIPPTVAPTETPTASPTVTPSSTPTVTSTPTETSTPSMTPTKTATLTGSETATPFGNFQPGDKVVSTTRVNCRDQPTTSGSTVLTIVDDAQQLYIVESPQAGERYDWAKVQLQDAATTQCYMAAQYLDLVQAGQGVPPTITLTPSITPTSSKTATLTPSNTPTASLTPTQTATLTGSETATSTSTPSSTPTETMTPTVTFTPSNTPLATNTSTPTYNDLHAGDITKATSSINCRASMSAQSDVVIILVLNQNDQMVLLTDPEFAAGYWWNKVRPLGTTKECYVASSFLDLVKAGGGLTATPTATGSATVETAGPYKVGDTIQTTTNTNLRTDGGTSYPVVATIKSGTKGTVLSGFKQANGLDWIQVQFPGNSGWITTKYTKLVAGSATTFQGPYAAGTQLVVIGVVNLRLSPGSSNSSMGQLQKGQQGLALGPAAKVGNDTWIQVEFSIGSGWVDGDYVKKLTSVTPTPAPSASNIWVYLDCTSNPERVIVQNNNLMSVKVISIGSLYDPAAGEPYSVGHTLGSKVTMTYQSGSKASSANAGNKALTTKEMFSDNVGAQEGAVIKTSIGDIVVKCPPVTTGEKWIEVNLTTQTLYAYRGSTVISSSLVSTGRPGFSTPTGTFYIFAKYVSVNMSGCVNGECWDTPGVPWDMLFRNGGFYIHGAYWHHDFGKVRSHGCVNLPVPYAEWLYGWTPMGTRVWIHY